MTGFPSKAAFAVLFSALLVWTQWLAVAAPLNADAPPPPCCDCEMVSCCAEPASSDFPTAPAAPPRTLSQTDWQILSNVCQPLLVSLDAETPPASSRLASSHALPAVPLYTRNCRYLI